MIPTFRHRYIDTDLPGRCWGQTAAADLDGDGRPEFISGQRTGTLYWFDRAADGSWSRHVLGVDSPSDVGLAALDVDGDGRIDIVTGGAWYRNHGGSRDLPFERIVFDPTLRAVHDFIVADVDGDGHMEVITMSDQNDLRIYTIPADPRAPWPCRHVWTPVHAGIAAGDIDGDGHVDLVRSDLWLENVRGDGTLWAPHALGHCGGASGWEANAIRAIVCDVNRDGRMDIMCSDAEIAGGRVFWMENLDGRGREWRRHDLPHGDGARRGAYHSLAIGDFDGDGDIDVFSCEMEDIHGDRPPRWFLWENLDGRGGAWQEHVVLDAGLGGHEAVVADFDGDGDLDIVSKVWNAHAGNANGGRLHCDFLENIGPIAKR